MTSYKLPNTNELFEAGVHVGHRIKRWHPKMQPFIYDVRKDIHIINLEKTEELLKDACNFLYQTAKEGKQIVFVGTKRQASTLIEMEAKRCGALYVNERWLGGTLTNYSVIKKRIDGLVDLMKRRESGDLNKYTKKERLMFDREIEKLQKSVGGLINLQSRPGAVFVIDAVREKTAVRESNYRDVPVIALIDTNTDPSNIDHPIPGNDDAIKSISLVLSTVSDAIEAGYKDVGKSEEGENKDKENTETEDSKGEKAKVEEKKEKDEKKSVKKPEKKVKPETKSASTRDKPKKRGRPKKAKADSIESSKEKK